ncbi:MAG: TspO/MBR family protein [Burkholderiales bacterium]
MNAPANRALPALALFIVLVVLGGMVIGYLTRPGDWYLTLNKPSFNPPGWVFGPVWTTLYVMIGAAGWRLWRAHRGSTAMKLWWVQLLLNYLWSPAFFGMHNPALALVVIVALLAAIVATLAAAWPRDRAVALLLAPYLAWVAFATLLNATLVALN